MPESVAQRPPSIAIACGGTGGHLFPGVAVGEQLRARGCDVTLMISPKEVDQQAVKSISGMELVTLPAVGLTGFGFFGFSLGVSEILPARPATFSQSSAEVCPGDGGIYQRAACAGGKKLWGEDFSARIQQHSGAGEPVARAVGGLRFSLFSAGDGPPARTKSASGGNAGAAAISRAADGR